MRFRFTIRDLLWLAVVVALAVGWWVQSSSMQRRYKERAEAQDKWLTQTLEKYVQALREGDGGRAMGTVFAMPLPNTD